MSWSTIFVNGALAVTVLYDEGILYDGVIGLSGSVVFTDIDAINNCTLSVDGAGNVSLVNDIGYGGGNYAVDFAVPTGANAVQLVNCATIASPPAEYWRANGTRTEFTGASYLYLTVPTTSLGYQSEVGTG